MDSSGAAMVEDIINRLLEVRSYRPGRQVQLSEAEIRHLCAASKVIFMQQPILLELEAPIKICGMCLPACLLEQSDSIITFQCISEHFSAFQLIFSAFSVHFQCIFSSF
jgi:hypothetical protein